MKYRVRKGFVYVVSQRERYSAGQIVEVDEPFKVKPHMLEVVEVKVKPAKVEKPAVKTEAAAPKAKKTPAKRTAKKTTSRKRKTTKKVKAGE